MPTPRASGVGPVNAGHEVDNRLAGEDRFLARTGPDAQRLSDPRGLDRLTALARSLARPVSRGWLAVYSADATLILAVTHADGIGTGADIVRLWHGLRNEMRAAVQR